MRRTIGLILNALIVVLEIIAFSMIVIKNGGITAGVVIYYTRISNLIAAIAGVCLIVYAIRHRGEEYPRWMIMFRYIVTIMLLLTFLISLFVLSAAVGSVYEMMIARQLKFHHLLCPLLSIVSFIFFEGGGKLTAKDNFTAVIPTLIYGIVMIIMNALRVVDGPYPFLRVYNQPIWATILWIVGLFFGTCLLALLLRLLRSKLSG